MKQKMFLIVVAILFAATTADSFAQLTKIWDRSNENFALERLCRPGKLAVVSRNGQFLIDLTNGETIHSTKYPETLYINYWGDRYYVYNITEDTRKEYDVKTKEFLKIVKMRIEMPDSSIFGYNENHNSLLFYNANSGELLDSFKVPGSPDEPIYTLTQGQHFSYDGRFYAFHLQLKNNPEQNHFFLYDRQAREIILRKDLPANNDLIMQFFNKSNLMAYSEEVKLEGDDKKYSYIRIFDLDNREIVRNMKVGNEENNIRAIVIRNDDKFILYRISSNNETRFFDFKNNKISEYTVLVASPIFADDSIIVNLNIEGYKFDWNAVGVDNENPFENYSIIYPNPTTNSINLSINENYYNGSWEIIDITGNNLLKGLIQPIPQLIINIEQLPPQTYLLRLQKDNFTITYSVLKM